MYQSSLKSAAFRTALSILIAVTMAELCALAATNPAERQESKSAASRNTPDDELDTIFREYAVERDSAFNAFREARRAKKPSPSADFIGRFARRVLAVAAREPHTATAEKALIWLSSTPGVTIQPEAETALTILARDHIESDRLKDLLYPNSVLLWHSSAAEALLRRLMAASPSIDIRARATFQLADLLDNRAQNVRRWQLMGKPDSIYSKVIGPAVIAQLMKSDPKSLEDDAAHLYQRVIAEFATVKVDMGNGKLSQTSLSGVARVPLRILQQFSVGKVAPEIKGVNLQDVPMKLSDYRGKIVVLFLRGTVPNAFVPPAQVPQRAVSRLGRLKEIIDGKPVTILGVVSSDREAYKKAIADQDASMRFFWDPPNRDGFSKIRMAWLAIGEDVVYVLDRAGVIRYKLTAAPGELEKAVSALLDEPPARTQSGKPN